MVEYRRGIEHSTWQKVWHFNEQCPDYPRRGFAIAHYPPFHEDLCRDCLSLTQDKRNGRQLKVSEDQREISLESRLERAGQRVRNGRRKRGMITD